MSKVDEIRKDVSELSDRGVSAEVVLQCHNNQLANTLKKMITPSKIRGLSIEQKESLLNLLESFELVA